jgi:FtsZ-binding cell division protein ZapB
MGGQGRDIKAALICSASVLTELENERATALQNEVSDLQRRLTDLVAENKVLKVRKCQIWGRPVGGCLAPYRER